MASISSLFVELKLSAESFNNGLKEAQREAKEFEKNLKPTLTVTKDLGIAMTAAGGAIVAGMAAASKAAIDYGDKLNDARQRTGATVETLAKLGFAAEQSGSSFEGLSTGVRFLARNMEAAIAKTGDQRAAFNALGISSKDLIAANGDINQTFLRLADRFKELPDGAEKSALAMRVFGKSGADLIPLLNEGSAGIRKLGDDAQKAGLVISQDFASASDELNDTLNEVKASALGASVGIAQALLPTLQSAASFAAEAGRQFAAFTKEHPQLVQATAALGAGLLTLGSALTAVAIIVPKIQAGIALLGGGMAALSGIAIIALIASLAALYNAYQNTARALENLQRQLLDQQASTNKAAKALADHKIQVDLSGKSQAQQAEAIAKAGKELQAKLKATEKATVATKDNTRVIIDEGKALKANEDALKREAAARDLAAKGMRIALDMRIQDEDLLPKVTKLQFDFTAALKAGGEAAVQAAADLGEFNQIVEDAVSSMAQAQYNAEEMQKDFDSISRSDPGVQIGKGFDTAAASIKKNTDEANRLSSATSDIKNAAGHIFDDMFIKGESVFSSLGAALKGGVLSLGRAIFEDVAGALLGPVKAAFDVFFEGLLESTGIKKLISGLAGSLADAIGGIFGSGGGAAAAAGTAASTAGSVGASAAGSAAGGVGGGLAGGIAGGVISGLATVISSMRLEGTLNAIEANTRFTYIELRDTMDHILQPMLARLIDIKDELLDHKYLPNIIETLGNELILSVNRVTVAVIDSAAIIGGAIGAISFPSFAAASGEGASTTAGANGFSSSGQLPKIPGFATGTSYVSRGGMANLHRGEAVVPAGQNRGGGGMVINIGSWLGDRSGIERLARLISDEQNRYVENASGRLISSGVRR